MKKRSGRTLRSKLAKVDAHVIQPHEYRELPELKRIDARTVRRLKKRLRGQKETPPVVQGMRRAARY